MAQTRSEPSSASTTRAHCDERSTSLDVFVGEWHMEGKQLAGPIGPDADITAVQTFEWLDGHAFLIHRFDGRVGDSRASCIEIIGYDRDTGTCRAHTFYNHGLTNVWDIEQRDGAWRLLGDWNLGGNPLKARCTINFGNDNTTLSAKWECSSDGKQWQTFWDTHARKAVGH